jgi:hypothetical protein
MAGFLAFQRETAKGDKHDRQGTIPTGHDE